MLTAIENFLAIGGPAAWIILILAGALLAICAERFNYLYLVLSRDHEQSRERIRGLVLSKDYAKALQVCGAFPNDPVLSVLRSGLMATDNGREAIKSSLGGAIIEVSQKCEKRIHFISMIANIATLLGLLGTIFGLIKTFAALGIAESAQKAEILGRGISEAMYATAFGLVVAVAAIAAHSIFSSRCEEVQAQSQDAGYRFIQWIEQSERA